MIQNLVTNCCNKLQKAHIISEDDYAVYAFGIELILASVIQFAIIYLIALPLGLILPALCFSISFCILKRAIGGFHSGGHASCLFISTATVILCCWFSVLIAGYSMLCLILTLVLAGIACLLTFYKAPVVHPNNPKTAKQLDKCRKRARKIVVFQSVFITALVIIAYVWYPWLLRYFLAGGLGIAVATATLFIPLNIKEG